MANKTWAWLQLFSDGGEAAPGQTGEQSAADAGQQTGNRANEQDAAAPETTSRRMTWEEIKADPEYNREIQTIVRERLRSAQRPKEHVNEAALHQSFRQHILGLEQQGEAMKQLFPGFDLRRELDNPAFARMTAPDVGISVEDAYYALHRGEIQSAAMQVTAQKTAQMISESIRSGQLRPRENGVSGQGASVSAFDYRSATPEQRSALKKRIREAAARGEKLYPGR